MKNKLIVTSIFLFAFIAATAQVKTLALGKGQSTADTYLHGTYTADPTAVIKTKWYKVSGNGSTIVTPDSAGTKVTSLKKGTYQYGFIVKDVTHNLSDTDFVKVIVK